MAGLFFVVVFGCKDEAKDDSILPPPTESFELRAYLKSVATQALPTTKMFEEMGLTSVDTTGFGAAETEPDRVALRINYAFGQIVLGNLDNAIYALKPLEQYRFEDKELHFVMLSMLGLAYQRMGEINNCNKNHNADACILPFASKAVHIDKEGSTKAIQYYSQALELMPDDMVTRWLLTICYETIGDKEAAARNRALIQLNAYDKPYAHGQFTDVAAQLGIADFSYFGGMLVEDFDKDGLLDVFNTSFDLTHNPNLYFNNGQYFAKRTLEAGLDGITGGENIVSGDYNNDGLVDVLILRGGWLEKQGMLPQSLLQNNGDGTFTDVTKEAGLLGFYPAHSAAWADVNNDGWLDLFIGVENYTETAQQGLQCRFYLNNGNGTFKDVAQEVGVEVSAYVKGVAFADFNNDGYQDLYLSTYGQRQMLFINLSKEQGYLYFEERAAFWGATEPILSFPVMVFDFNNDGWEDVLVTGYEVEVMGIGAEYINPGKGVLNTAKLFVNKGDGTFEDATERVGLNRSIYAMGLNFGDIDNDGWLDFYAATGIPDYRGLYPNLMFRNAYGKAYEDVTAATRTGHLQKGHGVSFADFDRDGDQDLFVEMGGIFPDDQFFNLLFQNPGSGKNWVNIRLEGTASNKIAYGARLKVTVKESAGADRFIYRTVGNGSSYGCSPLEQHIGLGHADKISEVTVTWPTGKQEVFKNIAVNSAYTLTEGSGTAVKRAYQPLKMQSPPVSSGSAHHHH